MNKHQLLDMMNSIRDKYVMEAVESREQSGGKAKSHLRLHRVGLLAAVLAALLLLAGCVAVYLRLQDMSIGKDTYVQSHDEKGRAIEPTEKEWEVLNFSGIAGSPEQKASAQWYEFTESYDPEGKYLNDDPDIPDIPNNYEYVYGCYTKEMVDKLDEIKDENHLQLLETQIPIQRYQSDIALEALGKTSLLREGADATIGKVSGFLFAPYNFKLEYDLTLTGDNPPWSKPVMVTELFQHKGYIPYNGYWGVNLDAYQQWNYTTSQGVSLLIAWGKGGGFLICPQDDGILTINISGSSTQSRFPEADQVPGKEAMEAFAEAIDFSLDHAAFDAAAIQPKLDQAEAEYEAAHAYVPEIYESYGDYLLGYNYGCRPGQQYTFYDLTQDGNEELLLGTNGLVEWCLTTKNGQVEELPLGSFRLCQDDILELSTETEFTEACRYAYESLSDVLCSAKNPDSYVSLKYENGQWTKWEDIMEVYPQAITQEEADAIRAAHPLAELGWMPIEDFPMDETGTTLGGYLKSLPQPGNEKVREIYASRMREAAAKDDFLYTHYRIADINGDGIDDLLLSGDGDTFWQPLTYRYERLLNMRVNQFYLCEGDVLECTSYFHLWWDDNAEVEEHIFYRIGKNLERETLAYAGYNKATASWQSDRDGTPMSTAEAEAILAKYPRIDQGMKPISELIG